MTNKNSKTIVKDKSMLQTDLSFAPFIWHEALGAFSIKPRNGNTLEVEIGLLAQRPPPSTTGRGWTPTFGIDSSNSEWGGFRTKSKRQTPQVFFGDQLVSEKLLHGMLGILGTPSLQVASAFYLKGSGL